MKTPVSYCLMLFRDPGQNRSSNLPADPGGTLLTPPQILSREKSLPPIHRAATTRQIGLLGSWCPVKSTTALQAKHSLLLSQNDTGCFRSALAGSEGNSLLPAGQDEAA